jgi:hypothetical protein
MAKRKRNKKFARKLPVWITDKALHDLAKRTARAEKRSLSAVAEQALRNYLARMTVLDEIDKALPGNEELTLEARQRVAGTATPSGIHASIVTDQPGCPVAAPCVLEGCRYADLDDLAESFAGGDKAVVAAAGRLVEARLPKRLFSRTHAQVEAMRDPGKTVKARRAAAEEVASSGKRMLKKHAKTFEKLAASEVTEALGAEVVPGVNARISRAAQPRDVSVLAAGKQCCRRDGCKHSKERHWATKGGQLRCGVALCNCARYME